MEFLDFQIWTGPWIWKFGWKCGMVKDLALCKRHDDEQDRLPHPFNDPRFRNVAHTAHFLSNSSIPDDIVSLESVDRVFFFNLCLQCLSIIHRDVLDAVSFVADEEDLNHSVCSRLADCFIVRWIGNRGDD